MRRTIREKEPPRPSTRLTMEMSRADRGRQQAPESKGATSADHRNAASDEALASNTRQLAGAAKASSLLLERRELIKALRGDLDWIVMKCLEKDRTRRYETANGLAMDLLRHLKGEPVVARPQSKFYRFQKLARRNKLVFLAAAGVALALVLGTAGSTLEAVRARRAEREQQRLHREADRARGGEAEQRVAAERHLYDALLGEARAKQLSGRAGQRFESLEAIGKAAAIRRTTDLSDAAVTAFALPDVREQKRWRFPAHWMAANVCFDESCELYACITNSGIVVRRVQDEQQVSFLTLKDVNDFANGLLLRRFDSRSRYLAASCVVGQGELRSRVWELTRAGTLVLETDGVGDPDFSPDGMAIAMLNPDGSVSIEDLETGKELRRLGVGGRLTIVRFSPDGTKLAGLENGGIAAWVMDASSGQTITTLPGSGALSYLSWSRDGNLLAMGYVDGRIEVWDVHASRVRVRLAGHEARVTGLAFSQQGNMLASASWDSTLRLWDVPSGRQWVMYRTQDVGLHFSRDDRTLAYAVEGEVTKLLEVGQATGYRRLSGRADGLRAWNTEFSPDGRLMVVSANDGIGIWDTDSGKEIGHLPTSACRSARFQTYGGLGIIGCTEGGLYRWPLRSESTARGSFLRLDPPQILAAQQTFRYAALNADGRKLLASREVGVDPLLLDLAGLTNRLNLQGHFAAQFVTLDPAGRWAATGTWKGIGVKIYDAVTGELLHELPVAGTAVVAFSPDGNWLATANMTELKLWQTSSWDCAPRAIPGDHVSEINPLAFSPDGRLLAYMHGGYEIRMVKVPSCEVVATLRVPSLTHVSSLTFSPDGARFAALEWSGQINIWDLRALRRELVNLNLDWDLPPFPPATNAAPFSPARLQFDAGPFSEEELAQLIPRREPDIAGNLIDLSDYYNAPLTESWHSPRAAKNDLSGLTPGIHELGGVGFDVRGLIQLGVVAPNFLPYPNHVLNIPIGRKCRRLHFLHAAIYSGNAHLGDELGSYVFHYADGRQEQRPIVMGKDMVDWWSLSSQTVTNCQIAWTGKNPVASREGHSVRLFKTTWENPFPNVPIVQFDFTSDKPTPGQPFLVAVTAEP
jgi:WD40 repeat protein